jgi:hypothetical protein
MQASPRKEPPVGRLGQGLAVVQTPAWGPILLMGTVPATGVCIGKGKSDGYVLRRRDDTFAVTAGRQVCSRSKGHRWKTPTLQTV